MIGWILLIISIILTEILFWRDTLSIVCKETVIQSKLFYFVITTITVYFVYFLGSLMIAIFKSINETHPEFFTLKTLLIISSVIIGFVLFIGINVFLYKRLNKDEN